jgi:hypothetical protein
VARGRDVFDLVGGYRFHALALSRKPLSNEEIQRLSDDLAGLPSSTGLDLSAHAVAHSLLGRDPRIIQAESNQVFQTYGLSDETPQGLFLVRPDGYIAYRSDRLDVTGLKAFIRERFAVGALS